MKLPTIVDIKVALFEFLEKANDKLRSKASQPAHIIYSGPENPSKVQARAPCLWVYVSTIGELNAVSTLVESLCMDHPERQLVILTDHSHYLESFVKQYPQAIIVSHGDNGSGIQVLFKKHPPEIFLIAEIPMTMFDAPCRLSFRVLHYCKKYGHKKEGYKNTGSSIFVVNGWLYKEFPTCTMDRIEKVFFKRNYTEIIDTYLIQQDADTSCLLQAGVCSRKIHVTGNLKFDNLISTEPGRLTRNEIVASERFILVSGCVTNISEQELIIKAFQNLKPSYPDLLLILAPRHPENKERMDKLNSMLNEANLTYQLRTEKTEPITADIDLLILNTIGELKDFYSLGDICYVGLNHNLLEPLSFLKPTYVTPGWDARYPSFPVYQKMIEKSLIVETKEATAEALSESILKIRKDCEFTNHEATTRETMIVKIQELSGALNKNLELINATAESRRMVASKSATYSTLRS